ncbi:hypothetical protein [Candidatus Finniella inopinata]|uniref:Uncharacterized protein n=1 Tax=Candidatus Finniella inopinata TaxID=1696036 RepID=A0A4Q7DGK7_9PROT|nr:hypothetical protein [Candidatus Finniella inopinata]RZI45943.1 hypothetical protein EQU50_05790 [Candidatus Finniella inopinata]
MNIKKIHITDDFFSFSAQDAVQAICQNMFDGLDFDHFSYRRHYDDGRTVHFINNPANGCGKSFLKALYGEGAYATLDHIQELARSYPGNTLYFFGFVTPLFSHGDCTEN